MDVRINDELARLLAKRKEPDPVTEPDPDGMRQFTRNLFAADADD